MKKLLTGLCFALCINPALVVSEESPFCGKSESGSWPEIRTSLVGDWVIEHQSGYAKAGNMIMPFAGDGSPEVMSMSIRDGELVGTHPQAQEPLVIRRADEGRWNVDVSDPYRPDPVLSPDEVGLIYGCDQMDLPRLIGTSVAMHQGTAMNFTYRLMATEPTAIYGVMEMTANMQGMPLLARRTVWMRLAEGQ